MACALQKNAQYLKRLISKKPSLDLYVVDPIAGAGTMVRVVIIYTDRKAAKPLRPSSKILATGSYYSNLKASYKFIVLRECEARFAAQSFITKTGLFWLFELLICNLDQERAFCAVVGRGSIPCVLSFAVMDLVVIPRPRRRLRR